MNWWWTEFHSIKYLKHRSKFAVKFVSQLFWHQRESRRHSLSNIYRLCRRWIARVQKASCSCQEEKLATIIHCWRDLNAMMWLEVWKKSKVFELQKAFNSIQNLNFPWKPRAIGWCESWKRIMPTHSLIICHRGWHCNQFSLLIKASACLWLDGQIGQIECFYEFRWISKQKPKHKQSAREKPSGCDTCRFGSHFSFLSVSTKLIIDFIKCLYPEGARNKSPVNSDAESSRAHFHHKNEKWFFCCRLFHFLICEITY